MTYGKLAANFRLGEGENQASLDRLTNELFYMLDVVAT
jgi:hypothetical protein